MADWFAANAPQQQKPAGDWFEQNAPTGNVSVKVSFPDTGGQKIGQEAEPGYWQQVASRFKEQFFPNRTVSLPEAMGLDALTRQYGVDALKQDFDDIRAGKKTISEFLVDKIPFIGPSLNEATKAYAQDKPKTAAAILTTDVLAPAAFGEVIGRTPAASAKPVKAGPAGTIPSKLYESALKPSTTLSRGERAAMVQGGLENRIPVSAGGIRKLDRLVRDVQNQVASEIQEGTKAGVKIDPRKVAQRADDIKPTFQNQVNPVADIAAIEASKQEFLGQHPVPMTATEAQATKTGTYKQLGKKPYGELKGATVEAQKALARGIKEELNTTIPEIAALNEKESRMLGLAPALEKAVNRIKNWEIFGGIHTPLVGTGIGVLTGSAEAGTAAAIITAVLRDPNLKSRLAIAINYAQSKKPGFAKQNPAMVRSRIDAYVASLAAAAGMNRIEQPEGLKQ